MGKKVDKVMHWDVLPRWESGTNAKVGSVKWGSCSGVKVKFKYGDIESFVEIVSYDSTSRKLLIRYLEINEIHISTVHFKQCKIGVLIGHISREHFYPIGRNIDNLEIIKCGHILDSLNRKAKAYQYKCKKCGFDCGEHYKNGEIVSEFWISESNLSYGSRCACCDGNKVVVTRINSIYKTDIWMCNLGVDTEWAKKYSSQSSKLIKIRCPNCDVEYTKKISRVYDSKSIVCKCGDGFSYPEKLVTSLLMNLNINFKTQLGKDTFKWCNKYKYDFYDVDKNIIIETHGMQHYGKSFSTIIGAKTLHEERINDRFKKELALDNGIKEHIEIDCRYSDLEFIKNNILNSRLYEIYDLGNVDWNKCGEFAMSNLSKKACDLWNEGCGDLSTLEIGEILKVSSITVYNWLRKWDIIGKCNYTPKITR